MKVLVTGGAGFIGSNLVDALTQNGHEVYAVDNLSTGKIENINDYVIFHKMDIRAKQLISLIKDIVPEVVFHLAAQVSVPRSVHDPVEDVDVNVRGTINLLNVCSDVGVRRVIFSSSAAVYGIPESLPITEAHPLKPISPYGASKAAAENYLQLYHRVSGLEYVVLRYSNVYGLRQDNAGEGGVVSIFADRIHSGQALTIFGSGNQTRDFVYVKDIVRANLTAINCLPNSIVNICTGKATSVNELAMKMKNMTHLSANIQYKPGRPGDILHSILSRNMAYKMMDWKPIYELEDGLKEMLDYDD